MTDSSEVAFLQPQRPNREKRQIESPECPTQDLGGNPESLDEAFEEVTDLLLGRYVQELNIMVTGIYSRLNVQPHQIS